LRKLKTMSYNLQIKRLLVDNYDDPVKVNKLFNTQINNNTRMRNYCSKLVGEINIQRELINLHETQEHNEITNLICTSILDDIIHKVEIEKLKKAPRLLHRHECLASNEEHKKNKEEIDKLKIKIDKLEKDNLALHYRNDCKKCIAKQKNMSNYDAKKKSRLIPLTPSVKRRVWAECGECPTEYYQDQMKKSELKNGNFVYLCANCL